MRPDLHFPAADIIAGVKLALGGRAPRLLDATQLATALLGDAIATNLFMLGYAWQLGLVPVSHTALMRAIELNGAAVEMNQQAFAWGRLAAVDPQAVAAAAGLVSNPVTADERVPDGLHQLPPGDWEGIEWGSTSAPRPVRGEREWRGLPAHGSDNGTASGTATGSPLDVATGDIAALPLDDLRLSRSLDELIARRAAFLADYQDASYARRYTGLVAKVREAEAAKTPGSTALAEAVARYAFKLMAYKDEYEVARLYTSGEFQRRLQQQFEGDYSLRFHLAPPLLAKKDEYGRLLKREYGPWVFTAFRWLARLKFLRGTALDPFGRTAERRMERQLVADYFATIEGLLPDLDTGRLALAAQIASIPEHIRGYGHVKDAHLHKAKAREAELLREWDNPLRVVVHSDAA
jgi:indolepyruvate ferredoxin oxidoreductase